MEDLKKLIKESVKGSDEELGKKVKSLEDLINSKKVDSEEEKAEVGKKFIKALAMDDKKELKAIDTMPGSFGYTVPTYVADKILEKKDKIAKMRKYAFVFKMNGPFQLPTEGTAVTAYWVGENLEVTASSPNVGKKSLDDYYLTARVLIPYKLLNTSAINLTDYLANRCSRALGNTEETSFVAGSGSSQPEGLRTNTAVETLYLEGATIAYNDVVNLFYGLKEQYRAEGVWLSSAAGIKLIRKLKDSNGLPIFDVRDQTIFGRPLLESEDIPSNLGTAGNETEIWFGDPSFYWIKDGEQMMAEKDKIIEMLQVQIVIHEAVDGKLVLPEAFKFLTGVK